MRTTLVFPPPASPTYIPLGIASLVSYLKAHAPEAEIVVRDLNVALWRELALRDVPGRELLDFVQGRGGPFSDPMVYSTHQPAWSALVGQVSDLDRQARTCLQTNQCPATLATLLDSWTKTILADEPDMVGFSVMFLDQAAFALALARRLRERAGGRLRLIFGGAAMSALDISELLCAAPFVDGVLPGEGEQAMALLCDGAPLATIPALRTPGDGGIHVNASLPSLSIDALGAPDFSAFDLSLYFNPTPVLPVVVSRGCDWQRCRFCAHNFSFQGYRCKDVGRFVDELALLTARHGAQHFYLADQYISAPTLERLSDEVLRRGLNLRFHTMARPTQDYTPARLAKAAAAGCRWISWGIETGSQRLLNLVRKGTRREVIDRLMEQSHAAGIVNLMMMIFGLPTSTEADLEQTFEMIEQVYPHVESIKSSSFVLFDGTPFAQHPERFGLTVRGRQELLRLGETPIHSARLHFKVQADNGTLVPPPGPIEVNRWTQRRRWLGDPSFLDGLCCEHFLLYCSRAEADGQNRPLPPAPRKAA